MDELQYILEIARANAEHIRTLNDDYTALSVSYAEIKAQVDIIMWFIGINVVAWLGLLVSILGKKFKNNKK